MSFQIIYKNRTFIVTFASVTSIDEINDANGKIQGGEHFDNHNNQIWDFTNADLSLISEGDMIIPAVTDFGASTTNEDINIAIVAVEEQAINLCKAYIITCQKIGSPWAFKICPTIQDALKWVKT